MVRSCRGEALPVGRIRVVRTRCEGGDSDTGGDSMAPEVTPEDMPEEVVGATPEATPEEMPEDSTEAPAAGEGPAPAQMPTDGAMPSDGVPCSQTCFYEVMSEMEWTADRCSTLQITCSSQCLCTTLLALSSAYLTCVRRLGEVLDTHAPLLQPLSCVDFFTAG